MQGLPWPRQPHLFCVRCCWAVWLVDCLLPQTHLNQLCLAWLSQHATLAAVTGPEHWAKCQACCKIHWNFIWPLAAVPTRNTLAGTCSQAQASLGVGEGRRQPPITDQICPPHLPSLSVPLLICTSLLINAVSSYEVSFKMLSSILSPGFVKRKKNMTIPPKLREVHCTAFLFFLSQYWFAAAFWEAGTILCVAMPSGTLQKLLMTMAAEAAMPGWKLASSGGGIAQSGSLHQSQGWASHPIPTPFGYSYAEVPRSVAGPRPNRSSCRYSSKGHCQRIKGIPGAPHPKHSFEHSVELASERKQGRETMCWDLEDLQLLGYKISDFTGDV